VNAMETVHVLSALDVLEEFDARNITWGLLDESRTLDELVAALDGRWNAGDPQACVDLLVTDGLIVQLPREWPNRYRTRMAESVRLFVHLRQLFPGRPWQAGSPLVSDYRFLRRARRFPRRFMDALQVADLLSEGGVSDDLRNQAVRVIGERRLSRFQLDASLAVLGAVRDEATDSGVVVGAGTGSGKTLSFYLPALSVLGADGGTRQSVVAIYPRNELLKDQLATALIEIRNLRARGGRQLTLGAYFGPTPFDSAKDPEGRSGWRKRGPGFICPFLRCPGADSARPCDGDLIWTPRRQGRSLDWGELKCQRCSGTVSSDEVRLTRKAIQDSPPDILFTTTEMLNLSLSDGWSRHVFGVGPNATRKPALVLLDEIHTYTGTTGAQAALLLRRWRRLLGSNIAWVGLNATLANATDFFAGLCGLSPESVTDIRPDEADMVEAGAEYQLLLRGDPASQSALLSTSIQSLMLLRRVLDETGHGGRDAFGTRVFAFLENLDLVNRLYRQLLDAEGRDPFGRPAASKTVLATLRSTDQLRRGIPVLDVATWEADGQCWWMPETLGFGTRSLSISRTSSQDSGVAAQSDIVIASSSLEVGYDDQRVGAVLQHKAPRDVAQFLQRRGRAGRQQHQRPWTVVVLSDYGRDRQAFQGYEALLDPVVPPKTLPLGNQAVRKMQAAMCLLDWIALRTRADQGTKWSVRRAWSAPGKFTSSVQFDQSLQLLSEVLDGGPAQQDLVRFVQSSLLLDPKDLTSVSWENPRSLLLDVVPTAYRRLASEWATVKDTRLATRTDVIGRQPLPEYIPENLFSDLELPEVVIAPPADYDASAGTTIGIAMGLSELAPGKVTLRWAVDKVRGLWIEPPEGQTLALEKGFASEGQVALHVMTADGLMPLVRPFVMAPTVPPAQVKSTSNGRLHWNLDVDSAEGTEVPRPRSGALGDIITNLSLHLSTDRGSLALCRYARSAECEVVTAVGRERRTFDFSFGDEPAVVGFRLSVDAIVASVDLPLDVAVLALDADHDRLRQLRSDRFLHLCQEEVGKCGLNRFVSLWVAEVALSAIGMTASEGTQLEQIQGFDGHQWQRCIEDVVDGVLSVSESEDPDEVPLRRSVLEAFASADIRAAVTSCMAALANAPDETWLPWLRRRILFTLGAAWQEAAQLACPEFNAESDLMVDVIDGYGTARLIFSDPSGGGGNLVEALARAIADDPRRFDQLVVAALAPSTAETVDQALRQALNLLTSHAATGEVAERFRGARSNRLESWKHLLHKLDAEGVRTEHSTVAALGTRIFRSGSSSMSDELLRYLLLRWETIESEMGFSLDARTMAVLLAKEQAIADRVSAVSGNTIASASQTLQSVLQSLLWPTATAGRHLALQTGNRFVDNAAPSERTLLLQLLPQSEALVTVDDDNWRIQVTDVLGRWGTVRLTATNRGRLAGALRDLIVNPIELSWLLVYPSIGDIKREGGQYSVRVDLREAPQ